MNLCKSSWSCTWPLDCLHATCKASPTSLALAAWTTPALGCRAWGGRLGGAETTCSCPAVEPLTWSSMDIRRETIRTRLSTASRQVP